MSSSSTMAVVESLCRKWHFIMPKVIFTARFNVQVMSTRPSRQQSGLSTRQIETSAEQILVTVSTMTNGLSLLLLILECCSFPMSVKFKRLSKFGQDVMLREIFVNFHGLFIATVRFITLQSLTYRIKFQSPIPTFWAFLHILFTWT